MEILYCTLAQAKHQLSATTTTHDSALLDAIHHVSRRIDMHMSASQWPWFAPWQGQLSLPLTHRQLFQHGLIYRPQLPILSLTQVEIGDTRIAFSDYTAQIGLDERGALVWQGGTGSFLQLLYDLPYHARLRITGIWGQHRHYAQAWQPTTTLNQPSLDTTSASCVVADSTPFAVGQLIALSGAEGTEWAIISAVDTLTHTLTLERGVHGTLARNFLQDDEVSIFNVEAPIQRATARQAAFLYARRGGFEVESVLPNAERHYPGDFLPEVAAILAEYTLEMLKENHYYG